MSRGNTVLLAALGGAVVAGLIANYLGTEQGKQLLSSASDTLKDVSAQAKEITAYKKKGDRNGFLFFWSIDSSGNIYHHLSNRLSRLEHFQRGMHLLKVELVPDNRRRKPKSIQPYEHLFHQFLAFI